MHLCNQFKVQGAQVPHVEHLLSWQRMVGGPTGSAGLDRPGRPGGPLPISEFKDKSVRFSLIYNLRLIQLQA